MPRKLNSLRSSASLERKPAKRVRKQGLVVYCEGEITEPRYIEAYYASVAKRSPITLVGIKRGAGTPDTIVKACIDHDTSSDSDTIVWAVFDVDEHQDLERALDRARRGGIPVSLSDPCIEVWGLLHFRNSNAPLSRHAAQRELRRVMPGYHHEKQPEFKWTLCQQNVDDAIDRANAGLRSRWEEGNSPPKANPSTTFQLLLKFIMPDSPEQQSHALRLACDVRAALERGEL
ncbi:RloB family protein [Trinickia diaoshuihuensis]|uniref:RloB family protein n=1 Tax=Trinickia diaoshuihuensis TaxID=2292265 RepID=UPI000E235EA3